VPSVEQTIHYIEGAKTWDDRVARMRQVPQRHGTNDHPSIYAAVARSLYVPHLGPDYAYVHWTDFYDEAHFTAAYRAAERLTAGFTQVTVDDIIRALETDPTVLLPLRVITGLGRNEFADATRLLGEVLGLRPVSPGKVDALEKGTSATTPSQARLIAETVDQTMRGVLFGNPPGGLRSKQDKPDTVSGWESVQHFAAHGVPYGMFLHQRHYGGAFRQLLDATSELRGDLIENAVESLFNTRGVPYIRTGSHNQAEIATRFEVTVQPAPDFVVFDSSDTLRAMLECKGANDGGTARDKALRYDRLHAEAVRLGGIPLLAVLGGLGWTRVNDTLGPVVRDCDGRVFSVSNLAEMMTVSPFLSLVGTAS
jgi:hypothetical protein